MMKHNHLDIIMKEIQTSNTEPYKYFVWVGLPSGTSEKIEVCQEDYDRLKER